ncbi:MAG: hypothetical protein CM1200mP28_03120 [Deltaproteobacteria bacterium]|nr:MAG: hypothetical protein CM1200mP28_03120 [Deltaproteobacteria bacterium]
MGLGLLLLNLVTGFHYLRKYLMKRINFQGINGIPDNYRLIFMHGGAQMQFSAGHLI